MSIVLARHGATEWSVSGRHTGTTDVPLTEQGVRDGQALAPVLATHTFVLVATSPRHRAQETCRLAGLAGSAEVWDDLAEWDYGEYEGRTTADIRSERPDWELFRDGCPGGESPAAVSARADGVIARLVERGVADEDAGDVALFAHGHILRVLGARWAGWPVEAGLHLMLDTGTLSVLDVRRGDHIIRRWNAPLL
jgi:probable phosphoglycerate mutase